jgi:poly(3-hydroxybutyrate) depolymerase
MLGESRPMPGRNLATVLLLVAALVGCGGDDAPAGIRTRDYTVHSKAVDRDMAVKVVVPEGGRRRPLLVFLHGRGGDEGSYVHGPFLKALKALGARAPIVAFPDGDEDKYWHKRESGDWGRYVMREVIPQVAEKYGADRRRVAIGGISMGGFGAFDLARLHPRRFCAVGGHSPALWRTGGETAPGAFDDAADFAQHDLIAHTPRYRAAVAMDTGTSDPFRTADEAMARTLGIPLRLWPGGHGGWEHQIERYLRFYADACDPRGGRSRPVKSPPTQ